jgi:choline dehydrogenase-like flavoprotein
VTDAYDIVIIGSGAGGGTIAHALAGSGARLLVVERGDFVPREVENWSAEAVWRDLRYRTREQWLDERGETFTPYTHYNVGGNTKFWGSVLYRLRREDFHEMQHADGVSPAWPIDYDTLAPYYDRAEQLYRVRGAIGEDPTEPPHAGPYPYPAVPHAAGMGRLAERLRAQGLHPSPLPLGLIDVGGPAGCRLCNTCNSFVCQIDAKSDADVVAVRPLQRYANVTLWTNARARRLVTDPSGRSVAAVEVERHGQVERVVAATVIVACGAVNSAALLLGSATGKHPDGLANSSGLVGRRYMAHLATMLEGVHWRTNRDEFQKTLAINDFYLAGPHAPFPLGQIQSQGRTHAVMAKVTGDSWRYKALEMRHIPLWAYEAWVSRATDWLAMTEDLPDPDNRVRLAPDGRIVLDVRQNNQRAHALLVEKLRGILSRLGYWSPKVFAHMAGTRNTTHQCGTLVFGTDPRASVLDPFCRAHDVENLFVVDASFFPSSAAVNPGLTIAAQALRVADHILGTPQVPTRTSHVP